MNWGKEENQGLLRRGKVVLRRSPTPYLLWGVAGTCGPAPHLPGMATLPSGRVWNLFANTHSPFSMTGPSVSRVATSAEGLPSH